MTAAALATEMVTLHNDPSPRSFLKVDSLAHIDLGKLSQSELRSLSHTSSAAFDLHSTDNLVIPEIDRSIFNESSGSRRQTYSRLRPVPRSPNSAAAAAPGHRRRFAGLLPTLKLPPISPGDPEASENRSIVDSLKRLVGTTDSSIWNPNPDPNAMALVVFGNADSVPETAGMEELREMEIFVNSGQTKRKRDRKPKGRLHNEVDKDVSLEIVNKNGVAVDLEALSIADDLYEQELRSRTVGMESEVELLGFLKNLGGQWGSRRKKRKIVDASEFGDALPIGWKLLIGLKRKVGRVSVYCRRYLSPSGQHFASCKEASSYLQSYFGLNEVNYLVDHCGDNVQQDNILSSASRAGAIHNHKDYDPGQDIIPFSNLPGASTSNERKKEVAVLGIDNLAEVQVRDLFECHKCNMIFDEKDAYLQHLLSSHQKTTRRYRLRASVGDGVILKDGKYECQFCHKVFNERRRYNGHVGIHVRNNVRSSEELPGQATAQNSVYSLSRDDLPRRFSKMDALIEIAQSSILEGSSMGLPDETNKLNVASYPDSAATNSEDAGNVSCHISKPKMEDSMIRLDPELAEQDSSEEENEHVMMDDGMDKIDGTGSVHIEEKSSSDTATEKVGGGRIRLDPELGEQDSDEQESEHVMMDDEMENADGTGNVLIKENSSLDTATVLAATEKVGGASDICDLEDGPAVDVGSTDHSGIKQLRFCESNLLTRLGEDGSCTGDNNESVVCVRTSAVNEVEKYEDNLGGSNSELSNDVMETIQKSCEGNVNFGVTESLLSLAHCFPSPTCSQYKGDEFCDVDPKLDNATGFDELRLDELEPLKFSFLTNDAGMDSDFGASVQFGSGDVMLNMVGGRQFTAVCVWCRMEFNHQAIGSEIQSDSVGYMCPTCKAKISAFPMNAHQF